MSECLFCDLIAKKANALYEDEKVFAMLSPEPFVAGHVLVMPRVHAPILEAIPDPIVAEVFKVANKFSAILIDSMKAEGTNVLVQNGPPAGQVHNHAMVHVLPRFETDKLQIGWNPKPASDEELGKAEGALKEQTKNVGAFEKEKPKPKEVEAPKDVPKTDWRLKYLRRLP